MAAMGLFDVKGLVDIDPSFQLSTPLFDKIEIKTGWGSTVTIESKNNSPENYFINSLKVNGDEYHQNHISLQEIKKGAKLEYELAGKPNKKWFTP